MKEAYLTLAKIRILTNYVIFLFRFRSVLGTNGQITFDGLNIALENEMEKLTAIMTKEPRHGDI